MDQPRFTIAQVAHACEYPQNSLRSHLQRGHWQLEIARGDSRSEAGKAHLITLRRALHIGTAIELIRNGIEPARAYTAARSFLDEFDPQLEDARHKRGENGLFESGWTLLVAYPDIEFGVIMRVQDDEKSSEQTPLRSLFFPKPLGGTQRSGVFVWLNQIDRQIRRGLGV